MLYPLKFTPLFKDKIWGGSKIKTRLGLDFGTLPNCGEAWVLSGVAGSQTAVANGFLAGNELNEILEIYMDELVGESVFSKYPGEFPILVKFIDANDWLSVQVHPDDAMAARLKTGSGKTEMWYVLDADPGAQLISGFSRNVDADVCRGLISQGRLKEALNFEKVAQGDSFLIQSGRIHALGPGILLAEIQQTSDTTFRLYDWDRTDASGKPRELHADLALEAIDYGLTGSGKARYRSAPGTPATLAECPYFITNLFEAVAPIAKDYSSFDSFVLWIAVEGAGTVAWGEESLSLTTGEVLLIPAVMEQISLLPQPDMKFLEVYIP